jgi:hypothetical protein
MQGIKVLFAITPYKNTPEVLIYTFFKSMISENGDVCNVASNYARYDQHVLTYKLTNFSPCL